MAFEPRPERGEEVGTGTSRYLGKHALNKSVESSVMRKREPERVVEVEGVRAKEIF